MTADVSTIAEIYPPIPLWIKLFGGLLVLIGGVSGMLGLFSPETFFNDFPTFQNWEEISYVTTGWGIRNIAMAIAMVVVLLMKVPKAIGAVFLMRFVTEGSDLINSLMTGHGTMGLPLSALAIGWIVLFLVPEAMAAFWGLSRSPIKKNAT